MKEETLSTLDPPVIEFFPERTIANLEANKKAMTLRSLLDLSCGLDWHEPPSTWKPQLDAPKWAVMRCAGKARRCGGLMPARRSNAASVPQRG